MMHKTSQWMTKITLLITIIFVCSSCSTANQLAGSLTAGLTGFSGGAQTSLTSGGGDDFGSIGSDFAEESVDDQYKAIDQSFANIKKLNNTRSEIPNTVPYAYFKILKNFRDQIGSGNVNNRDETGKTPLVAAIEKNDAAMVQFLVDKGANVDEQAIAAAEKTGNSFILKALGN
ncbi:ankyrin repeat domain-containing protein [Candidatus Uabimicrobium amorphum]|uniref:Ankyrin repeat domain-containing protein n=1 Tax=Uabimicrobium amorphum TaxID=2596890 RepID=A0A5S9IK50_UABAM|nr:ankyrin repeat domain-containing protein [Candidatus Uabimicrobium amorphum]BBM82530.1 hypothetical protein UABAM_00873 [Candidatus Uabimicrobium amorphum]